MRHMTQFVYAAMLAEKVCAKTNGASADFKPISDFTLRFTSTEMERFLAKLDR